MNQPPTLVQIKDLINETITPRFDTMDQRLDTMDQRLDNMDQRLDNMDQRLDNMDQRLDNMDQRLDNMDQRLLGIEKRVDGIDSTQETHDRYFNKLFAAVINIGGKVDYLSHKVTKLEGQHDSLLQTQDTILGILNESCTERYAMQGTLQRHEERITSLELITT